VLLSIPIYTPTLVVGVVDSCNCLCLILTCCCDIAVYRMNRRSRGWFVTVNWPSADDELRLLDMDHIYHMYQHEEGKDGTHHIQGMFYFKETKSLKQMREFVPRAHWEVCADIAKAIAYCSKPDGRLDGPYEWGERPRKGKRSDIQAIVEMARTPARVDQIVDEHPSALRYQGMIQTYRYHRMQPRRSPPEVYILWGDSGTGKTSSIVSWFGIENCFFLEQPANRGGVIWFDRYQQEKCLVLDDWDFRDHYKWLLRLCDRYPFQQQCKGLLGGVAVNSPYICLTSNEPPESWFIGGLLALARRITGIYHIVAPIPKAPELLSVPPVLPVLMDEDMEDEKYNE